MRSVLTAVGDEEWRYLPPKKPPKTIKSRPRHQAAQQPHLEQKRKVMVAHRVVLGYGWPRRDLVLDGYGLQADAALFLELGVNVGDARDRRVEQRETGGSRQ